ncbi:hypothetical protein SK128_009947, partial [Halocaridina rubra]
MGHNWMTNHNTKIMRLAKCSRNNCRLNHDLLNNDCSRLLEAAGIDTNESPRDVLVALFEMNPTLRKRAESREYKDLQQLPPVTAGKDNSTSLANTTDFTSSENKDKKNKPKKPRTVWSYEGRGDVVIPEICFDSVESRCSNESQDVRRRPEVHLEAEEEEEQTDSKYRKIPHEWENMQQGERLKRVDVPQTSEEYKNTVQLLPSTISAAVTKLERIQNRFHWTAFQNKVEEMTTIYGDIAKVDVRQLFHGTNPTVIQHICSENFDPRLHGQAAGQAYGQ